MPRQENERTIRVHIHIFQDDWEFIRQYFAGPDMPSPSAAVRTIVRAYLRNLRTKVEQTARPVALRDIADE